MDYIPIIAVVVVILFISLILYFVPLGLWIQSVVSLGLGKISIIDLIRMRLRKIPPRLIVDSIINMQKAGLININDENIDIINDEYTRVTEREIYRDIFKTLQLYNADLYTCFPTNISILDKSQRLPVLQQTIAPDCFVIV